MRPTTLPAALIIGVAIATPLPTAGAEQTAAETIGLLEAQGFTVNIDRIGSAPLSQCVVLDVRNPHEVTRWIRVEDDDDVDLIPVVVSRSISVSLDCT